MEKAKLKLLLIQPDTTMKQAMQKLVQTSEKILFVADKDGKLIGTVTDGDIRRKILNGCGFDMKICDIMNKDFVSVAFDMPQKEEHIKHLMIESKIEQIPVLDRNGAVTDVILWTDFLAGEKPFKSMQLQPNQVVIMAGGKGTRLDPFTKIFPKPLVPVGSKPIIEIIMERFYMYGFHKFIYTLNYKKEYIKLYLKENAFSYTIDWVEEEDFLGTAGSLSLLKDRVKETFFVVNCDSLMDINFNDVLEWHKKNDAAMTIIGCHNEVEIPFGVLHLSNGRLEKILEKPVQDVIINTGIYIMEPRILSYLSEGKHIDMNEFVDIVGEKEKITVYPIYDGWLDMGQWEEYKKNMEKIEGLKIV